MTTAAIPTNRRIPPPRVYASINRRRSTIEAKSPLVYENDHDHEKCLIAENELRETNRRQLMRIDLLERDYRQLDDDLAILQNERDLLLKQKQLLDEELDRTSYHASANVDLHVYTQKLESECRDLRSQIAVREKEKFELNEIIADCEVQIKQAHERHEEWRDTITDLEAMLSTETENRQCLEIQIRELNQRQTENENQIRRLENELNEVIASKQEIIKSNYILVQNSETLREQLRTVRTQAAEVQMICSSTFDSLDESLPGLVFDDDTPEQQANGDDNCPSSLFSEINTLETMSNEMISKCFNSTTNDIELDVLLAKSTTLSSILSLLNQLINEVKLVEIQNNFEQDQFMNMKLLLKKLQDNTQIFNSRFRKLQLLVIASREQQQCHQAELDDFFRLVDKRLVSDVEEKRPSLVTILENYEHELDRLRQLNRTNDENIRLLERKFVDEQNQSSRWRLKNTLLEKNQKKLMGAIKELNSERRQLIESSNQRRTRRRVEPAVQVDQQVKQTQSNLQSVVLPLTPAVEPVVSQRLTHSRSLPCLKSIENGRKSRNDSGVVLNDDLTPPSQSISVLHHRRRIKSNHFVTHTSSHVCFQKTITNLSSTKSNRFSIRFHWFFHLFFFLMNIILSFLICEHFYSQ